MAAAKRPSLRKLRRFVVEALEPRLLYSADLGPSLLGAALVSPVAEQRILESEPAPLESQTTQQTQSREIVFVDDATPDAERLLADIAAQPGRTIDVIRIGADEDGLARISAELAARQDISAVHIISHGSDAAVYLGRSVLDLQSVETRAGELAAWSDSLTAEADLLIYGCDVAQSGAGQALVERLAALTGADVAASTNMTGSAPLGGDLILEFRSGAVEAQNVLNDATNAGWQGLLAVTADASSSASSNTPVTGLTWSHTVSGSGSDRLLLVTVGTVDGAQSVTSVTYGGTALTQIGGITETAGKVRIEFWYLKAPDAGTADVVVNIAGATSMSAGATTFFGVDQTTPYSATAFEQGGGGAISVSLASAAGELVVDGAVAQAVSAFNAGADQTQLWNEHTGGTPGDPWNSSSTEAGAASVTMSWTKSGSGIGHWASGALSLKAAPNSAPVLNGANALASIAEDASVNSGTSVSSLISGQMSDANAPSGAGIAVTALDNTNGTWQYSTDGGASWSDFGTPSAGSARLLAADADTYVRFVPNANWSGTVAAGLTFRGWDQTTGIAGDTADVSTSGGSTAFSAASASTGITVTPVNDAPAGTDTTVTTLEDSAYVFAAADFGFSDGDGNALAAVRIASLPAAGTLTNNGIAVTAGELVSAADLAAGLLRFTPAPDANGTGYASFTFQVQDDGGTANGGADLDPTARTMMMNVTAVNDAPLGKSTSVTTLEDTAYIFTPSDFGFADADGNAFFEVRLISLPSAGVLTNSGVALSPGATVSAADIAAGLFHFTPAADASGAAYASFRFQVRDDGGTANGGVDIGPGAHTMTVNVTAVNDAPSGANNTVTTLEDTAYVFAAADFGFSDADANALTAVTITSLPASGALTNNGVAVSAGQMVSAADIASGLLRFTPAPDGSGAAYGSFTFQVQDDGGTVNGGVDVDPIARTMTVDVTSVNDAPSGANNMVTMLEDSAYVFAAADFGFSDADGGALVAVRIASLPASGTLTSNGLAVTAGQLVSAADIASGLLRFAPAPNGSGAGYASFTFQVQDNGGTANGGVDLDPVARTMSVEVTAVNDAPSAVNGTVTTLEDTAYVFAAADFGFSDADGNAFAAVRITSVPAAGALTDNGVAVSAGQMVSAANIAAGLLRFAPTANANGAGYASFSFQVQDDGGTANGGVNVDPAAHTMTLNVAAVNDAPSGANNTVILDQDAAYVFSSADFGFTDSDGNALAGVLITTAPAGGVITDDGAPVSAGQTVSAASIAAGLVRYTPAVGASGLPYASFAFRVQDSGGTANGGVNTDAIARTMTIDVLPSLSVGPVLEPPAPVPAQPALPVPPVAAAPGEDSPALTAQTPLAAASARLLLASNDVFGTRVDVEEGFRVPSAATQPAASVFATAQRLANAGPATAPGSGLPGSVAASEDKQFEFHLFGSTPVSDHTGSASRAAGLAGDLERMRDDMGEQADLEHWVSGSMAVGSFGLTVGYVLWLLRGGALLASLLSSLPAWRLVDPLPVLSRVDDEEDQDEDEDAFVSFAQASPPFAAVPEEAT